MNPLFSGAATLHVMRPPKHNNILVRGYNFKIIYFNNNCHFNVNTCIIFKGNKIFDEVNFWWVLMNFKDISAMKARLKQGNDLNRSILFNQDHTVHLLRPRGYPIICILRNEPNSLSHHRLASLWVQHLDTYPPVTDVDTVWI